MSEYITINFSEFTNSEIYDFQKVMRAHGIDVEIKTIAPSEDELGPIVDSAIILLPLIVPLAAELRKALEAYLSYRKESRKWEIDFENNGKKLHLAGNDGKMPSLEEVDEFLKNN